MYIRTTSRTNKDGSVTEYVQLAHNYRDPDSGRPKPRIIYNFGRRDALDVDALRRLVHSISRFLGPEAELSELAQARGGGEAARFVECRAMGAAWLLHGLWDRLTVGSTLLKVARGARVADAEGVVGCILAMVVNRALAPLSKHATPEWLSGDVFVPDVPEDVYDERLYRAMDFLLDAGDAVQQAVYFATVDLLDLEVDLLLYDTTSTYFEMEDDDVERAERVERWAEFDEGRGPEPTRPRPQVVNDPPMRLHGYSRDKRPDQAQVVVGLAVTREGIPVRCWVWPGNTADMAILPEVKDGLRGWRLGRVVTVVDRGFSSDANLAYLRRAGGHWIAGERMRDGSPDAQAALARQGRYQTVRDNLRVKEVRLDDASGKRWIVCHNPLEAERDKAQRDAALDRLETELDRIRAARDRDAKSKTAKRNGDPEAAHRAAECALRDHPSLGRWLRQLPSGRLVIDRAKIAAEERLDGKYLLSTSDPHLTPGAGRPGLQEPARG
jgi:hypothetical protein